MKLWSMAAALCGSALLGAAGCGADEGAEIALGSAALEIESGGAEEAPPVRISAIAGAPAGAVVLVGLVEPLTVTAVTFGVPGRVKSVYVKVGDTVGVGQVLGELETETRRLKLDETQRRWAEARSARPNAQRATPDGPPPDWMLDEADVLLEDAKKDLAASNTDLGQVRRAVQTQGEGAAVARAIALHQGRTTRPSSVAVHRAAEDSLALSLVDDLAQRLRQLQDAIDESTLTTPVAGLVIGASPIPGTEWNTRGGEPAFEIVDPASYVVRAVLPASRARRLTPGENAWVELPSVGGAPPMVVVARAGVVDDREVSLTSEAGAGTAWVDATFHLPAALPRRVWIGEEVRIAVAP